jgi:MobA-like NTP transferase protein
MSCTDVAGVLLAAGTSSRMGQNKLFLEIDGETVLRRAARTAALQDLDVPGDLERVRARVGGSLNARRALRIGQGTKRVTDARLRSRSP